MLSKLHLCFPSDLSDFFHLNIFILSYGVLLLIGQSGSADGLLVSAKRLPSLLELGDAVGLLGHGHLHQNPCTPQNLAQIVTI